MEVDDGNHVSPIFAYNVLADLLIYLLNSRIPVYVLNALYLAPITLWTYLNYGRPNAPPKPKSTPRGIHLQYVSFTKQLRKPTP